MSRDISQGKVLGFLNEKILQPYHRDTPRGMCYPILVMVHTVHSTCAWVKPFPKIVPMAKLDILPLRYDYLVWFMYGYSGNYQIK